VGYARKPNDNAREVWFVKSCNWCPIRIENVLLECG
jgi:hypothetical protein